ncbi:MAG: DNA cytosine methyltransferase [Minisyncoccales bacterium]
MKKTLKVIDFFCGAGGFSEGFRQQGFDIVMGIDDWMPAVETHNLNHGLSDKKKDVLDFAKSIDEINTLPNTEIIIGSPPCVLFSLSNKGGKGDKTLGIKLIEAFLRAIAVKKHQPSSNLKAWFMENVPNSRNYIKESYTFNDLGLQNWAKNHNIDPSKIALNGSSNGHIINSADFGSPQKRKRFICGEFVATGEFPDFTAFLNKRNITLGEIKSQMPRPNIAVSEEIYSDPNYPQINLKVNDITDHFYDTGIYELQWKNTMYAKVNHPYMGKMSFPEDDHKLSRTIMATRSMTTREAIIYRSEYKRIGDGEYRSPTIREIATLMGFPYTYHFFGSETVKWRLVGNAVCPHVSSAIAKSVRVALGLKPITDKNVIFPIKDIDSVKFNNLNTFSEREFTKPPQKKPLARFRQHPFKDGNMTVALTNFNPLEKNLDNKIVDWYSFVFLGSGKDFKIKPIYKKEHIKIARLIEGLYSDQGQKFIESFDKSFKEVMGRSKEFQAAYERQDHSYLEPNALVENIGKFILQNEPEKKYVEIEQFLPGKQRIPTRQILAMYAINRLIS